MGAMKFALVEGDSWELRRQSQEDRAPAEAGWGEGAASALVMVQRLERYRELLHPTE